MDIGHLSKHAHPPVSLSLSVETFCATRDARIAIHSPVDLLSRNKQATTPRRLGLNAGLRHYGVRPSDLDLDL